MFINGHGSTLYATLPVSFRYHRLARYCRYHLKDVIVGKIYFLLVRIKIKFMELAIVRKEITGSGPSLPRRHTCFTVPALRSDVTAIAVLLVIVVLQICQVSVSCAQCVIGYECFMCQFGLISFSWFLLPVVCLQIECITH